MSDIDSEIFHGIWCAHQDLNSGPIDYEDPEEPSEFPSSGRFVRAFKDAEFRFEAVRTYSELR